MTFFDSTDLPSLKKLICNAAVLFPFFGIVVLKSENRGEESCVDIAAFECDFWPEATLLSVWSLTVESDAFLVA